MTPRKAIRKRCLDCSAYQTKEVTDCAFTDCPLYEHRSGHRPLASRWTPCKAIRKYCLWCMGARGDKGLSSARKEVALCPTEGCPLFPYRFGKNPTRKGLGPADGCPENFARQANEGIVQSVQNAPTVAG